jgi:hypothetical protein
MQSTLLPVALLLLSITCAIRGDVTGINPSGKADGKQFSFTVTDTAVKGATAWTRDASCPPLEPRRAIEIATKQLHELVKEPAKWYFHEISLVDFGDHLHWVYIAMFDRRYPADMAVFGADYFLIPVLMSGATLKPKVTYIGPDKIERRR